MQDALPLPVQDALCPLPPPPFVPEFCEWCPMPGGALQKLGRGPNDPPGLGATSTWPFVPLIVICALCRAEPSEAGCLCVCVCVCMCVCVCVCVSVCVRAQRAAHLMVFVVGGAYPTTSLFTIQRLHSV